ncbi:hypothetical protein PHSY_003011 [Pseudozyma hubeiensis SY62]|uniref:Uncharacterized protein n=1 Tax=Pseudozyma hubeiensis (strain SY62) TaxID=1305764 RepID=R9PBJ1_PSEHS|nr:hypothetical protein PHSY_003011 [Pseudozyma hubeiensis SY62]GAC95435.1 hypothetical protein PHSY_003011 [Pseudozyma hubeiensis SY62]
MPLPTIYHDVSRSKNFSEDGMGSLFTPHLSHFSYIQGAQAPEIAAEPDLGNYPPPRPARSPKRERHATARTCTLDGPWPHPPYCYDPFVDYEDSSSSQVKEIDCSREDSIDIDPHLCSIADLRQMLEQTEGQSQSARTGRSFFEGTMPEKGFARDPDSKHDHSDEQLDKLNASLLPASTRALALVDSPASHRLSKGSNFKAGRGIIDVAINVFSRNARPVQSVESCDPLVTIRQRSHPATLDDEDALDEAFVPASDSGGPPRLTVSPKGSKSNSTATEVRLGPPKHSRGLRKQIYPPRVRYSMLTVSSFGCGRSESPCVVSTSGPLLRCAMDEKYPFDSPRSASDFRRPSL